MDYTVYYNGELLNSREAPVSVYDHGFLFGDGIRVILRVCDRRPVLLGEHLADFFYSAEHLGMDLSITEKTIEKTIRILLDQNSLRDAFIILVATRGEGYLNFNPNVKLHPNILIMACPPVLVDEEVRYQGIAVRVARYRAVTEAVFDRQISTLSSQHEILNLYDVYSGKGRCFEGLIVNTEGYVCECTRSSIFIVEENKIYTPDLSCGVKNRAERKLVIRIARNSGIPVYEGYIPLNRLVKSSECFVAGTEIEVLPVIRLDSDKIGTGVPGNITCKVIQAYRKFISGESLELAFV